MPIILGGGISGLSAAYYLLKSSRTNQIRLLEASNRLGGWIRTEQRSHNDNDNRYLFESGPRTIRPSGPAGINTLELMDELGLSSKIIPINSNHVAVKNRMIYVNGKLCLLPSDIGGALRTIPPFSRPLIFSAFKDLLTGRSKEPLADESIYKFTERRFGTEVAKYLISSMICGICAGNAKEISVKFLMKDLFLKEQKYGGVIKGVFLDWLEKKNEKNPPIVNGSKSLLVKRSKEEKWSIYSLASGLEEFPKALTKHLEAEKNVKIQLNEKCTSIEFTKDTTSQKVIVNSNHETDRIISSIPSYTLAPLVAKQHPQLADDLQGIPFVNVAVVNLHYASKDLLKYNGFGLLTPPSENLPILGVIFDSCCFEMGDNTVLTVMMGGHWFNQRFGPNPSESDLRQIAIEQIRNILDIQETPTTTKVNILKNCIPQYVIGHHDRVARIRQYILDRKLPLQLCGSSYDGVGVNDVILSARNAVGEV